MSKRGRYRSLQRQFKIWHMRKTVGGMEPFVYRAVTGSQLQSMLDRGEASFERGYYWLLEVKRGAIAGCGSSGGSSTAFSRREIDAIVGLMGKSRTIHLTAEQRQERIANKVPDVDFIERSRQKFDAYCSTH